MKEFDAISLCPYQPNLLDGSHVDEQVTIHVGRRRKKHNQKLENYHFIRKDRSYDYIDYGDDEIDSLSFRILKFPLSTGTYEYIATNLPVNSFPPATIKELYNLRWREETAFRHLKYAGNMVHIHSIKPDFLVQEIYGKLTLYNFSSCVTKAVTRKNASNTVHSYNFNHTQIQKFVRLYLIGKIEKLELLVDRFLVPVRPGRRFKRIIRRQSAEPLIYR